MARVQVLGQRCPYGGKMLIRGVFTQKKKLWVAMEEIASPGELSSMMVVDDVTGKELPASYGALCDRLRVVGRATVVKDGEREFQVVDAETNLLRGWDVGEEGPKCNPVAK